MKLDEIDDPPPTGFSFPLIFTWTLPPLPEPPDLLVLSIDLAGIGGDNPGPGKARQAYRGAAAARLPLEVQFDLR